MKYERIERSIDEIKEFFEKIDWGIAENEVKLIFGNRTPEIYLAHYLSNECKKERLVVDFFFKKVEEFEEGDICWFYDDNSLFGCVDVYNGLSDSETYKHIASSLPGCRFKNCIPIKKFIKILEKGYV